MSNTAAASTRRLLELCVGYFVFYVMTGILVKLYTGMPDAPLYHKDITYLANNTLGGAAFALAIVFAMRWFRLHSNKLVPFGPWKVPSELAYILPSGICTAVVIPTTTLMYTLPISVLVAMVIMRGSIIVIGRAVDAVQIRQGILKKRVYGEEDLAVLFALAAVGVDIVGAQGGGFDFAAVAVLASYIVSYAIRIYIMNYYKNTRARGVQLHNEG